MKKIICGITLVGLSFVMAGDDLKGIVQAIDSSNKIITVNGMPIKVMPYTKIEQKACSMGWDTPKKFVDLKDGDLVEVDLIYNNNQPVAKEIEIECMQNRAY